MALQSIHRPIHRGGSTPELTLVPIDSASGASKKCLLSGWDSAGHFGRIDPAPQRHSSARSHGEESSSMALHGENSTVSIASLAKKAARRSGTFPLHPL